MNIYLFDFDNTIVSLPYEETIDYLDQKESLDPNLNFTAIVKTRKDYIKYSNYDPDGLFLLLSNRITEMKDPLIIAKEREMAVKEGDLQRKIEEDKARLQLDATKAANRDEIERERIKNQTEIAGAKIGQQTASDLLANKQIEDKAEREEYQKGIDIGLNIGKDINKVE